MRQNWPERLGSPPPRLLSGVPDHVDGRMLAIAEAAGGRIINRDRMWHYVEGIQNWNPIWSSHGIRIFPGPSSVWLDARGNRLPTPLLPGFDTLATLAHLRRTGYDHSWFVLTQRIIAREFALSVLTRKTLGGLETDLSGRVLDASGESIPGLYAAGDVAGFGGGGTHGYRALEGTFLGGCLSSGLVPGRAAAVLLG